MPKIPYPGDPGTHDLSPWVHVSYKPYPSSGPGSSRVSAFRYDHAARQIQVQWQNNKNEGYLYGDPNGAGVSYEEYRSFARAASRGRRINTHLNRFAYYPMAGEETLPSNSKRRGLTSRMKN